VSTTTSLGKWIFVRRNRQDNSKKVLRILDSEGAEWMKLHQDHVQWGAVVLTVLSLVVLLSRVVREI
jgi:hypothetical protein